MVCLNNFLEDVCCKKFIVAHCRDGHRNEDETAIDCGGSCIPCNGMNLDNICHVSEFNDYFDIKHHIEIFYNMQDLVVMVMFGYRKRAVPLICFGI